ncbi:hypothetical protein N654_0672 [Lactiplantibacillus plantarum 4_3]|uniref:hypothetical protein n=1 Tax=Lactiplantibacillus plantarum TaxID=1590 RepID=UPI0003D3BD14|nr:hypothetical protein N654_0672 [Lactiplantibacillus plantarum 4_3]
MKIAMLGSLGNINRIVVPKLVQVGSLFLSSSKPVMTSPLSQLVLSAKLQLKLSAPMPPLVQ